jgi:hypothetical protein
MYAETRSHLELADQMAAYFFDEELVLGEIDPEAARATHVRRRPGEHEWDTIADRRPGLYERLLRPGVDRQHPER